MNTVINAKELRARLPQVVAKVKKGARFTVIYRSRPAFQLVPLNENANAACDALETDPLYRAGPLGRSSDGLSAAEHDKILYR